MEELTQVDEGVADLAYPPEDITVSTVHIEPVLAEKEEEKMTFVP